MLQLSVAPAQSAAVQAEGSLFSAGLLIGVRGTHGLHALFLVLDACRILFYSEGPHMKWCVLVVD